jgi:type I restriction enzyme M protein
MFEQTFKNIDDILHKDAGCGSELDYVEQTSWILFLKYLDDLEKDKKTAAELSGKKYTNIISTEFQWSNWAAPKDKDGKLDHHTALTGDDLADFVNIKLFPYFKKFKADAESADTIEYKIGEIFSELKNRIQSGYNLREVINRIDELRFRTHAEKHEMSHLYEDKIKNMGNAGRNGGEYYTPRPLIRTIIKVVAPKIGETIYDAASGSAGFLCEAFDYLKNSKKLTTSDVTTLQKKTFYGKEKKSLAYIIGTMNMILHGIEAPNIIHTNTLAENLSDIQEKDRYDVILANPPFGGKERAEVQQNFPIKTGETASLFMQHFIKILKAGGKAGVVIKNTFLSNTDNASVSLRKLLLESCNLHTVLDLPGGTFTGAGVKTVVLFFEKGSCCFISTSDSFIVCSSSFSSVVSVGTDISFSCICFLIGPFFTGVVFSIVEGDDVKSSLAEVLSEAIFFIASIMSAFFNDSELIIPAAVAITRKSESFLPSKSLISIKNELIF